MDDDFYAWLMGAYEAKELNFAEIENACKVRCGARKLWEEFTFGHDGIGSAMRVLKHIRNQLKLKIEN